MFGEIKRIAVCFSGQARTWRTAKDNILKYFDLSEQDCQVDFFIHTWDNNQYRGKDDVVWHCRPNQAVKATEKEELEKAFNPKKIELEHYVESEYKTLWEALLYSFMKSIWLKKQYEVENDFTYDLVVRARLDINYPQEGVCNTGLRLDKFAIHPVQHLTAYSTSPTIHRFPQEFNYPNFDDVFFYSNSPTMDIVANCCRWYRGIISKHQLTHYKKKYVPNSAYWYGPGTILYRYLVEKGIHPQGSRAIQYYVVRKAVEDCKLNSIDDWKDICEFSREWYNSLLHNQSSASVLDKYRKVDNYKKII
jgi:hypothetical protein